MAPLGYIFFRAIPEDFGLSPDDNILLKSNNVNKELRELNWNPRTAMQTISFWIIAISTFFIAIGISGQFIQMVSIAMDNGYNETVATAVFLPVGVIAAVANVSSGV